MSHVEPLESGYPGLCLRLRMQLSCPLAAERDGAATDGALGQGRRGPGHWPGVPGGTLLPGLPSWEGSRRPRAFLVRVSPRSPLWPFDTPLSPGVRRV